MTYTFNLPYPPSVNQIWRRGNGRTYLSKKASDYRKKVAEAMTEINLINEKIACEVRVSLIVQKPDIRVRDLDNLPKVIFDSLTACEFWLDDSQVSDMRVMWADIYDNTLDRKTKRGKVIVKVEQL